MSETIKQAVARCRGDVFVLLHSAYTEKLPGNLKVSKPDARRVIDMAPKGRQPTARWLGENLLLLPYYSDED